MIGFVTGLIQLCTAFLELISTTLTLKGAKASGHTINIVTYNVILDRRNDLPVPGYREKNSLSILYFFVGFCFFSWIYTRYGILLHALAALINALLLFLSNKIKRESYMIGNYNFRVSAIILLPTVQNILVRLYKRVFGLMVYEKPFPTTLGLSEYIGCIFEGIFSYQDMLYHILIAETALFYVIYIFYAILLASLLISFYYNVNPPRKIRLIFNSNIYWCYFPLIAICVITCAQLFSTILQ